MMHLVSCFIEKLGSCFQSGKSCPALPINSFALFLWQLFLLLSSNEDPEEPKSKINKIKKKINKQLTMLSAGEVAKQMKFA